MFQPIKAKRRFEFAGKSADRNKNKSIILHNNNSLQRNPEWRPPVVMASQVQAMAAPPSRKVPRRTTILDTNDDRTKAVVEEVIQRMTRKGSIAADERRTTFVAAPTVQTPDVLTVTHYSKQPPLEVHVKTPDGLTHTYYKKQTYVPSIIANTSAPLPTLTTNATPAVQAVPVFSAIPNAKKVIISTPSNTNSTVKMMMKPMVKETPRIAVMNSGKEVLITVEDLTRMVYSTLFNGKQSNFNFEEFQYKFERNYAWQTEQEPLLRLIFQEASGQIGSSAIAESLNLAKTIAWRAPSSLYIQEFLKYNGIL